MNVRRTAAWLALAVCLAHAAGVSALAPVVDARELDERLKRLERLLGTESLFKLVDEMESLGADVRELRGEIEVLSHSIAQIREHQRELYLDTDQRLQRIEAATAPAETEDSPPQPATATGPTAEAMPPSQLAAPTAPTATDTTGRTPPAAGIDPFAEQQAYQSAFELLKSGRYEEAAAALQQFMVEYPVGSYADNAQYWLGETYYIMRRFDQAVQEFERLVSTYPNSQKITPALLKLGYAHDELGNKAEAERVLGDLVEHHPQSAAAGLARKRLVSIRQ